MDLGRTEQVTTPKGIVSWLLVPQEPRSEAGSSYKYAWITCSLPTFIVGGGVTWVVGGWELNPMFLADSLDRGWKTLSPLLLEKFETHSTHLEDHSS